MKFESKILNAGLSLAMEFGADWLKPIQSRLAREYPELTRAELDAYEGECRSAMEFGHAEVQKSWRAAGGSQGEAVRVFREAMLGRYAWIEEENVSRLFSQGSYYAWKDGELPW